VVALVEIQMVDHLLQIQAVMELFIQVVELVDQQQVKIVDLAEPVVQA
tara:strand:+ start:557 stop:700 length:144 start_codon:yes stop_codon:yes gene_type:complete